LSVSIKLYDDDDNDDDEQKIIIFAQIHLYTQNAWNKILQIIIYHIINYSQSYSY